MYAKSVLRRLSYKYDYVRKMNEKRNMKLPTDDKQLRKILLEQLNEDDKERKKRKSNLAAPGRRQRPTEKELEAMNQKSQQELEIMRNELKGDKYHNA